MLSAPARSKTMPYKITGIDVHKKMLAVVVSDVEVDGQYQFDYSLPARMIKISLRISLARWNEEQVSKAIR
jgi:hypothetical protein